MLAFLPTFLYLKQSDKTKASHACTSLLRVGMSLYNLLETCEICMHQGDRSKAQKCKVCKSYSFSKWQWNLFAINGITSWIKVQKHGSKLCQLSKHLIKEFGTSLGPVQHELTSIGLICNLVLHKMAWIKSEKWPTSSL